jgi:hypothetical protein
MVPENSTGSWGITATADLNLRKPMVEASTPSIITLPPSSSTSLRIAVTRDDLPAPVRPTMPTFSLEAMVTVTSSRTRGKSFLSRDDEREERRGGKREEREERGQ